MKIAIIGSRSWNNHDIFYKQVTNDLIDNKPTVIISGGAIGVDTMAEQYAREHNIPIQIIRPDYKNIEMNQKYGKDKWGKIAPLERNKIIANECDMMIAFILDNSSGTMFTIKEAQKLGKKVIMHLVQDKI